MDEYLKRTRQESELRVDIEIGLGLTKAGFEVHEGKLRIDVGFGLA